MYLAISGQNKSKTETRSSDILGIKRCMRLWLPYNEIVYRKAAVLQSRISKLADTLDTKVGEILKDTHAVETLEKYTPDISKKSYACLGKRHDPQVSPGSAPGKAGGTEEMALNVLVEINVLAQ